MKIKDFLRSRNRPVITIKPDETIHSAIQTLVKNNIGALPVCDNKGTLVGIISERDILKGCAGKIASIDKSKVKDVMTPREQLEVISPEDNGNQVLFKLSSRGVHQLPVMKEGKVTGVLCRSDVLRFLHLRSELGV